MKLKLLLPIIALALSPAQSPAADKKAPPAADLKIHPKVFTYVQGWLSDGESPIATEINLDAVANSRNQFNSEEIKQEDGMTRAPGPNGGFLRYRVIEHKGNHYKVEFQDNEGGTLTTAAIIEFTVEKREVRVGGKATTIHVMRVLSYADKL